MENQKNQKNVKKKKILNQAVSIAVCVALVVITFILILSNSDTDEVKSALRGVSISSLAIGMLCMLACVACEGECHRIICRSLGCRIGFGKAFAYACIDYYFSAITPSSTGGQPLMAYYMSKDDIPVSKSSISILLTLVEYMGVLVILGIMAFFFEIHFLIKHKFIIFMFIIGLLLSIALVAVSFAAMFSKTLVRRAAVWLIRILAKIHLIKNVEKKIESLDKQLEDYKNGARYIKTHPAISVRVFFICLVQRILLFIITYCVYRGMGLNKYGMVDILAMQAIVMLAVTVLPLPGSIGASEYMFMLVFAGVFPSHQITAAMILTRLVNFYFNMIFAGTVTIGNHICMLRKNKRKSSDENT